MTTRCSSGDGNGNGDGGLPSNSKTTANEYWSLPLLSQMRNNNEDIIVRVLSFLSPLDLVHLETVACKCCSPDDTARLRRATLVRWNALLQEGLPAPAPKTTTAATTATEGEEESDRKDENDPYQRYSRTVVSVLSTKIQIGRVVPVLATFHKYWRPVVYSHEINESAFLCNLFQQESSRCRMYDGKMHMESGKARMLGWDYAMHNDAALQYTQRALQKQGQNINLFLSPDAMEMVIRRMNQ